MEIKNTDYPVYLNYSVGEIPREKLTEIVVELATNAMFQMNSVLKGEVIKPTIDTIVNILKDKFAHYPLHIVAVAFDQGSLGQLEGTTTFKISNVYIWLSNLRERYIKLKYEDWSRRENRRKKEEEKLWKENGKGDAIFGTALSIKLSWVYSSKINPDNWDLYTLDDIVRLLRLGETPQTLTPKMIRDEN